MSRVTVNAYKMWQAQGKNDARLGARGPYRPTFYTEMSPGPRVKRIRREFWLTRVAAPLILSGVLIYALLRLAGVFS